MCPSVDFPSFHSLSDICTLVSEDLKAVNETLLQALESSVSLIPKLGHYLIASGGKRIRPLIMILAAKMCGNQTPERIIPLAACLEFIHAATLLHDDVVDESSLRRGQATANALWGNKASVLVGDFLFARAFQLMVADGSLDVLTLLSQASAQIVEGEINQLSLLGNLNITYDDYLKVIHAKTAPLFRSAVMVGGLINRQPSARIQALGRYGEALGIIFQLQDDVLDYQASPALWGKAKGDDFREGKMTLPVILAYQQAGPEEKAFWQRTLGRHEQEPQDFDQALAYLTTHNVFEYIYKLMDSYRQQAHQALEGYTGLYHQALTYLSSYCQDRKF